MTLTDDPVDAALVRQLRSQVARSLADAQTERERQNQPRLTGADEEALGTELINNALERHAHDLIRGGGAPLDADEEAALQRAAFNLLFGLGRLQPHLERPDVINL